MCTKCKIMKAMLLAHVFYFVHFTYVLQQIRTINFILERFFNMLSAQFLIFFGKLYLDLRYTIV